MRRGCTSMAKPGKCETGDVPQGSIVSGMWKFRDRVSSETLAELARSWMRNAPNRYIDLHIRQCSKDQVGIGFKLAFESDGLFDQFFESMTDQLRRQFGNNFVGWDIGQQTHMICHKAI